MKGSSAVPGSPSTSMPTWSNPFGVLDRVGIFLNRLAQYVCEAARGAGEPRGKRQGESSANFTPGCDPRFTSWEVPDELH